MWRPEREAASCDERGGTTISLVEALLRDLAHDNCNDDPNDDCNEDCDQDCDQDCDHTSPPESANHRRGVPFACPLLESGQHVLLVAGGNFALSSRSAGYVSRRHDASVPWRSRGRGVHEGKDRRTNLVFKNGEKALRHVVVVVCLCVLLAWLFPFAHGKKVENESKDDREKNSAPAITCIANAGSTSCPPPFATNVRYALSPSLATRKYRSPSATTRCTASACATTLAPSSVAGLNPGLTAGSWSGACPDASSLWCGS
jgi:hypothetical protein